MVATQHAQPAETPVPERRAPTTRGAAGYLVRSAFTRWARHSWCSALGLVWTKHVARCVVAEPHIVLAALCSGRPLPRAESSLHRQLAGAGATCVGVWCVLYSLCACLLDRRWRLRYAGRPARNFGGPGRSIRFANLYLVYGFDCCLAELIWCSSSRTTI